MLKSFKIRKPFISKHPFRYFSYMTILGALGLALVATSCGKNDEAIKVVPTASQADPDLTGPVPVGAGPRTATVQSLIQEEGKKNPSKMLKKDEVVALMRSGRLGTYEKGESNTETKIVRFTSSEGKSFATNLNTGYGLSYVQDNKNQTVIEDDLVSIRDDQGALTETADVTATLASQLEGQPVIGVEMLQMGYEYIYFSPELLANFHPEQGLRSHKLILLFLRNKLRISKTCTMEICWVPIWMSS